MSLAQVALVHTLHTLALLLIDVEGCNSYKYDFQVTHPYSGHFVSLYSPVQDAHMLNCWNQGLWGLTQGNMEFVDTTAALSHQWHPPGISVKTHTLNLHQELSPREGPVTCSAAVLGEISLVTRDC
jgi:hypothetical protein